MTAFCLLSSAHVLADMSGTLSVPPEVWWVIGAIVAVIFISIFLGIRSIPNNCVGIIEKNGRAKDRLRTAESSRSAVKRVIRPICSAAAFIFSTGRGNIGFTSVSLVIVPQGKIGYATPAMASHCRRARHLGGSLTAIISRMPANSLAMRIRASRHRAARPATRYPSRRASMPSTSHCLSLSPKDCVYRLEMTGPAGIGNHRRVAKGTQRHRRIRSRRHRRACLGGRSAYARQDDARRQHRHRDRSRWAEPRPGEIIAPAVGNDSVDPNYHNNYQDPEAFLRAGGRRGRQYVPLTDGTYFINRWFATIEIIPKTVVPIGYVGVVVSYYGPMGADVSGEAFPPRRTRRPRRRGVWERPLGPGKYPFNTYAGKLILVPTTNFVLHWITGKSESHHYDESLSSIDLVTKDAYEPLLPLSIVVHIDYQRAPSVIQRFGDVKKLITQTLDPMLSAYFRDVAHKKTMLELLQHRDEIQIESRNRIAAAIPRIRYRMRGRSHRQTRHRRRNRRRQDRNPARAAPHAPIEHRATGNLRPPAPPRRKNSAR